jgi:hypothetical protein
MSYLSYLAVLPISVVDQASNQSQFAEAVSVVVAPFTFVFISCVVVHSTLQKVMSVVLRNSGSDPTYCSVLFAILPFTNVFVTVAVSQGTLAICATGQLVLGLGHYLDDPHCNTYEVCQSSKHRCTSDRSCTLRYRCQYASRIRNLPRTRCRTTPIYHGRASFLLANCPRRSHRSRTRTCRND